MPKQRQGGVSQQDCASANLFHCSRQLLQRMSFVVIERPGFATSGLAETLSPRTASDRTLRKERIYGIGTSPGSDYTIQYKNGVRSWLNDGSYPSAKSRNLITLRQPSYQPSHQSTNHAFSYRLRPVLQRTAMSNAHASRDEFRRQDCGHYRSEPRFGLRQCKAAVRTTCSTFRRAYA